MVFNCKPSINFYPNQSAHSRIASLQQCVPNCKLPIEFYHTLIIKARMLVSREVVTVADRRHPPLGKDSDEATEKTKYASESKNKITPLPRVTMSPKK